jgi:hypothetical protein
MNEPSRWRGLPAVWLMASASLAAGADRTTTYQPSLHSQWTCYRGNRSQDARAMLAGQITQPRIAWRHFVGAIQTVVAVDGGDAVSELVVPDTASLEAGARPIDRKRWEPPVPLGSLAGKQQPIPYGSCTETYADVLPDSPGLEKIEFSSGFHVPLVAGRYQTTAGRCLAWRAGQWVQVWQTEPIRMLFQPSPMAADFDSDGQTEVAVVPFRELLVYDASTGRLKDRCEFTDNRSYGYAGVFDLAGDKRPRVVIVADFSKHVDVLGYRDGKLQVLWQRKIETDTTVCRQIVRAPANPVVDIEGDGRLEVLYNLWSPEEGCWRAWVHDGVSGEVKARLTDRFVQSTADLDGDGAEELLTALTRDAATPPHGVIEAIRLKGRQAETLWQADNAAWQMWTLPGEFNVYRYATSNELDVLRRTVDGAAAVVYRQRSEDRALDVSVCQARWEAGTLRPVRRVTGPNLEAIGMDEMGGLLLQAWTAPGADSRVAWSDGRARVLGSSRAGITPSTAVAAPRPGQPPTIVLQGRPGELVALQAPSGSASADVDNDGRDEAVLVIGRHIICIGENPGDSVGRVCWRIELPAVLGPPALADVDGAGKLSILVVGGDGWLYCVR